MGLSQKKKSVKIIYLIVGESNVQQGSLYNGGSHIDLFLKSQLYEVFPKDVQPDRFVQSRAAERS